MELDVMSGSLALTDPKGEPVELPYKIKVSDKGLFRCIPLKRAWCGARLEDGCSKLLEQAIGGLLAQARNLAAACRSYIMGIELAWAFEHVGGFKLAARIVVGTERDPAQREPVYGSMLDQPEKGALSYTRQNDELAKASRAAWLDASANEKGCILPGAKRVARVRWTADRHDKLVALLKRNISNLDAMNQSLSQFDCTATAEDGEADAAAERLVAGIVEKSIEGRK